MQRIPCFSPSHLEAACKVLADTTNGLKGDEIGYILADMHIPDQDQGMTKWNRLFNALAIVQNKHQVGNHLIMFINRAMSPVRYADGTLWKSHQRKTRILRTRSIQILRRLKIRMPPKQPREPNDRSEAEDLSL